MSVFDILAGTLDGAYAVDRRQRIAFWNESARRILGFPPEEVLGRPCYEILDGRDESGRAVCEQRCDTFLASTLGELSPTREVEARTSAGGRKWINVTTLVLPSEWHDLSLVIHLFRETSNRRQLEQRIDEVLEGEHEKAGLPPHPHEPLTPREKDVLRLLAAGASTHSIGTQLGIERNTVRTHVQHVLEKLGVHSRLEAVACASQNGLLMRAS